MKKILYICGGRGFLTARAGRKLHEVPNCWRRMGYEVIHFSGGDLYPGGSPSATSVQEYHNKWYRRWKVFDPLVRSASERRDIQHNQRMLVRVGQLIEEHRPDLVWERSSRLATSGLDIAHRYGLPFVLEWKDHLVDYPLSLWRGKATRTERRKECEADMIVVESHVLRQRLAQEGVDAGKIVVAHNAVRPEEFVMDPGARERHRARLRIGPEQVLVGYAGGYQFYHSMPLLVEAAERVRQRGIGDIRFLLVGQGEQYAKARALAERLGLLGTTLAMEPWVPKEQVPGVLSAMDIAVQPGTTDIICPIKVLEYMAMALAVVLPDYACNREVIDHYRTGWLFKPEDADALANAFVALASDGVLRNLIGREAREAVSLRFRWEQTWGAALEEVLRGFCSAHPNT